MIRSLRFYRPNYHVVEDNDTVVRVTCLHWSSTFNSVLGEMLDFDGPLANLPSLFAMPADFDEEGQEIRPCHDCFLDMRNWRAHCEMELWKMKKLSTFL
jgi:hypothetical protein